MLYFYSSFMARFELEVENHVLPAHHGHSLCDSHGGALKRIFIKKQNALGGGFTKAQEYVDTINQAQDDGHFLNHTTGLVYLAPSGPRCFDVFFPKGPILPKFLVAGDQAIKACLSFSYAYTPPPQQRIMKGSQNLFRISENLVPLLSQTVGFSNWVFVLGQCRAKKTKIYLSNA
jgi:hypothetical protein